MASESIIFVLLLILYWFNRQRRKYLRERIGKKALFNLYRVSRNISFMVKTNVSPQIGGNLALFKNGGILYSFHFGVWELMPQMLSKLGYRLGIITNRYETDNKGFFARRLDNLLYRRRSRKGVKVFYKEDIIKIVRFIKNGGLIGMLVDGNTFYAKYKKAERLAQLCGVPLVPFALYQENDKVILEINCNLENIVGQRPYDYLWFYKSRG